jgi:Uma2 family endonuclease
MDTTAVSPQQAAPSQPPTRHFPDDPFEELRNLELLEEDGEPMESSYHREAMNLLIGAVLWLLRGREDFYVGGNMFIYYNVQQARDRDYRGPDFFFVKDVPLRPVRRYWAVWEQSGRYPDVIVELTSPTTEQEDRTTKRTIYERTFRTREYYLYDFDAGQVEGWRLNTAGVYEPIPANDRGWLWCQELNVWLGSWHGEHRAMTVNWPRFFDRDGNLVPTAEERAESERSHAEAERQRAEAERQLAEAERQRAEAERRRAEAAEAELARLREQIARQGGAS